MIDRPELPSPQRRRQAPAHAAAAKLSDTTAVGIDPEALSTASDRALCCCSCCCCCCCCCCTRAHAADVVGGAAARNAPPSRHHSLSWKRRVDTIAAAIAAEATLSTTSDRAQCCRDTRAHAAAWGVTPHPAKPPTRRGDTPSLWQRRVDITAAAAAEATMSATLNRLCCCCCCTRAHTGGGGRGAAADDVPPPTRVTRASEIAGPAPDKPTSNMVTRSDGRHVIGQHKGSPQCASLYSHVEGRN
jgi:hypothetical protein